MMTTICVLDDPATESMPSIDQQLDALAAAVAPLQAEVDALRERVAAIVGNLKILIEIFAWQQYRRDNIAVALSHEGDAVKQVVEIISLLIVGSAAAFIGWAVVHLASSPSNPIKDDQDAARTPFRKWLGAARHRLLDARERRRRGDGPR